MSAVSPVIGEIELLPDGAVRVHISPDEPVFAGHYPDAPVFPGLCLVEYVRLGALRTAPVPDLMLAALESARFRAPVLPGDDVTITLDWSRDEASWHCSARASTARGAAANVRLRFRSGSAA